MTLPRPNLFIVGAMKAGTTALHAYLDQHPAIFMSNPKEPGFFTHDKPASKDRDAYFALFAGGADAQYRGESSTQYTKAPAIAGVAKRIHNFEPEARILYMVRDPVARIVSQYLFNMRIHGEERPLCEAVRADHRYRDIGDYNSQIAPYLELFGPDRVRVLSAEWLSADRQAALDMIFSWLGLESVGVTEARKNTSADGVRRHARLTRLLLRPELEPLRLLAKRLGAEALARRAWAQLNPPRPFPVSDRERTELRHMLAEEIAAQQSAIAPLMGNHPPEWTTGHG